MAGPNNAVIGDEDSPVVLPNTEVPEELLVEEKKLAKYSQTAEFKRLSDFMQNRIKFYQKYLPNGSFVEGDPKQGPQGINFPSGMTPEMLSTYWMAACVITREFENVLAEYAQAKEAVKEYEAQ